MRYLFLFSMVGLLTACSPLGKIQPTKPLDVNDLAVQHVYKIPTANLNPFNDPQLKQLINTALIDSPTVLNAMARVERAHQIANGTAAKLWPAIGFSGYAEKAYLPLQGTVPPLLEGVNVNKATISDVALKFNYEVDFWGKNREMIASRVSEAFAAQMDLAETRLLLSTAVASSYFELQKNVMQFQLAKDNAHLLKSQADILIDREKKGIESNIPVKTALANAQNAMLVVDDYKRAEMQSRNQLAVLLGKNPFTTQIDVTGFIYHKKQLSIPTIIPANLLGQRPDIASARALSQAAAHQINVAKSAFYPNINLKGLLSLQNLNFSQAFNVWLQNDNVTAAVDLPLFDGGARRANLGARYAEYEMTVNQYNQTILNALRQVKDQLTAMQVLDHQISAQSQVLHTTQSNYQLLQSRYTHGLIDYPQLIETKQLLIQQKITLSYLQAQQLQAYVALLAALGSEITL